MHTHTQQTAGGSPPACSDSPEFQISTGRRPCRALEGAPFSADWHCRRSQALVIRFEFHPSATALPAAGGGAALAKDGTRGEIMVTKKTGFGKPPIFEGIISVPLVIDDVTLTPRNTLLE